MKRPYFPILIIAMLVTLLWLYINRSTPTLSSTNNMLFSSPVNSPATHLNSISFSAASVGATQPVAAVPAANALAPQVPAASGIALQAVAGEITTAGLQRKVIGRATLELVVDDAAAVVQQINQLMSMVGGYVANTNLVHSSYSGVEHLQGTLSLRVPAAQLDATLARLEKMGAEARAQSLNREDVTDQYTDIDAQLHNLEATENELRELLAEVRKKPNARPDDILIVHRNMTDIRGQIDQLQGRKNLLNNLVGMSSIDITLTPHLVDQPDTKPEVGWQPMTVVRSTFHDLVGTVQSFVDAGIWLVIYFVPVLLMICIPVALIYLGGRSLLERWQRRVMLANKSN